DKEKENMYNSPVSQPTAIPISNSYDCNKLHLFSYCCYLLLLFGAHINFEQRICKLFLYVYQYEAIHLGRSRRVYAHSPWQKWYAAIRFIGYGIENEDAISNIPTKRAQCTQKRRHYGDENAI
ncbi:hypothetical protein GQX74_007645, partial [Glossina fuscipes]